MVIGQVVFPNTASPSQNYYHTPWFPRQGDKGEFLWELIDFANPAGDPGLAITVEFQTKNSEDIDSGASVIGTSGPVNSVSSPALAVNTIYSASFSGAEELVRFRFTILGDNRSDFWAHLRALNVSWSTN